MFLQQLGRGLRLADGKDVLTVLDFVGNAREEYDFEHKFRALIGRTRQSVLKELEHDFPPPAPGLLHRAGATSPGVHPGEYSSGYVAQTTENGAEDSRIPASKRPSSNLA